MNRVNKAIIGCQSVIDSLKGKLDNYDRIGKETLKRDINIECLKITALQYYRKYKGLEDEKRVKILPLQSGQDVFVIGIIKDDGEKDGYCIEKAIFSGILQAGHEEKYVVSYSDSERYEMSRAEFFEHVYTDYDMAAEEQEKMRHLDIKTAR